jgi:hypothetical protein
MPTRRVLPPNLPAPNKHPEGPWEHLTFVPALGLQQARLDKGWTIEQLAEASGYSAGELAEIEANPSKLRPRIVTARLSGALNPPHDTIRGVS